MRPHFIAAMTLGWLPLVAHASCPLPGQWWQSQHVVANSAVLAQAIQHQVVLLGEQHDDVDHHRWQLHTLAGLYALRDDMVIGLEMLPREAQPALDDWVAGLLSEEALLEQSGWEENWGFDADLYLPILHFARVQQIPLIALNITPELRQRLAHDGFSSVPADQRHHIPAPRLPSASYEMRLKEVFDQHAMGDDGPAMLKRFLQAQLSWDVAMAEGLANAALEGKLAVGLMGLGHMIYHDGVPHQLDGLGIDHTFSLLPWSTETCESPDSALADAVFVLPAAE